MTESSGVSSTNQATQIDLNQLRTFLAVYRLGSFTAAASSVGLSQPTVTAQIRSLEKQTARQLFVRLPRGVEPTPFAHELAGMAALPLDALSTIGDSTGLSVGRAAPVRLGGPSELLCTRVLPALSPLVADGMSLRVTQGSTDPLLDELRSGRLDLVIATRRPRGLALVSVPLADEEYVLVASPEWGHRLGRGERGESLGSVLREIPLVAYSEDMPIVRRYWRTVLGGHHPPPSAALTVPNLHAVIAAVAAGAGYSVVPRSICADHVKDGRVVLMDDPVERPLNTFFVVQRPGAGSNPDVVRVRETLVRAAREWVVPEIPS